VCTNLSGASTSPGAEWTIDDGKFLFPSSPTPRCGKWGIGVGIADDPNIVRTYVYSTKADEVLISKR